MECIFSSTFPPFLPLSSLLSFPPFFPLSSHILRLSFLPPQGESEYIKNYKSPADLRALSPDPPTHVSAGLSSAQLGVTREPAFSRKRKTPSHPDRKVTFTTDYIENGSPAREVHSNILRNGTIWQTFNLAKLPKS